MNSKMGENGMGFAAIVVGISLFSQTAGARWAYAPEYEIPKDENVLSVIGAAGESNLRKSFKMLVWNVQKGGGVDWSSDFLSLARKMDLVLVQEGMLDANMPDLFTSIDGWGWNFATSFKYDDEKATGVVTGGPVAAEEVFFLRSPDTEPVIDTPKMAVGTEFNLDGHPDNLLVVNIHALNFVTNGTFYDQVTQILARLSLHDGPIIFAGDFNTWNQARINFLRRECAKLDLVEVDFNDSIFSLVLDHVFVRGLRVHSARRIESVISSDHYPMAVQLEVL